VLGAWFPHALLLFSCSRSEHFILFFSVAVEVLVFLLRSASADGLFVLFMTRGQGFPILLLYAPFSFFLRDGFVVFTIFDWGRRFSSFQPGIRQTDSSSPAFSLTILHLSLFSTRSTKRLVSLFLPEAPLPFFDLSSNVTSCLSFLLSTRAPLFRHFPFSCVIRCHKCSGREGLASLFIVPRILVPLSPTFDLFFLRKRRSPPAFECRSDACFSFSSCRGIRNSPSQKSSLSTFSFKRFGGFFFAPLDFFFALLTDLTVFLPYKSCFFFPDIRKDFFSS